MKYSVEQAFFDMAEYQGFDKVFIRLSDDMEKKLNEKAKKSYTDYNREDYDDFLKEVFDTSVFREPELLFCWGMLVLMFGNYGCSPRTGWIEDAKGCIDFLREGVRVSSGSDEFVPEYIISEIDDACKELFKSEKISSENLLSSFTEKINSILGGYIFKIENISMEEEWVKITLSDRYTNKTVDDFKVRFV